MTVRQLQMAGTDVLVSGLSPDAVSHHFLDRDGATPVRLVDDQQLDAWGTEQDALGQLDAVVAAAEPGTPADAARVERMIAVASEVGVRHFVQIASSDMAGWRPSFGGNLGTAELPYTIVRPALLDSTMLEHASEICEAGVWIGAAPYGHNAFIDPRDVVACARAIVMQAQPLGSVALTGPERLSYNDVAGLLADLLDRPIAYRPVAPAEYFAALKARGLSLDRANERVRRDARTEAQPHPPLSDSVLKLTGRPAGTLAGYLEDHRCAFAEGGLLD